MSSLKKFSNRINFLNNRVKYGNEGGMVVDAGTLVVNSILNNVGIQTSRPTYKLDISTNDISAARIGNTLTVDSSNNRVNINGYVKPTSILDSTNSTGNEDPSANMYLKSTPSGLLWSPVSSGGGGSGGDTRFAGINEFSSDTTLTISHGQYIVPLIPGLIFTLPNITNDDNGLSYTFLSNYNFPDTGFPMDYRLRTFDQNNQKIYYKINVVSITGYQNTPSRVIAYNGNWLWMSYNNE